MKKDLNADAFIEGKDRQSSSQIYFLLEVKNNSKNRHEMGLLSLLNLEKKALKPAFFMQIQDLTDSAIPFPSNFCYCFYF